MAPSGDSRKKDNRKRRRRELRRLVRSLQTENERLKADANSVAAQQQKQSKTITRPRGSAGDGFNLRESMGLADNPRLYRSIQRTVRGLVTHAGLDHRTVWRHQPKELIVKLFRVARKRQPFLRRFVNDWATEEFAKQYLKNRRAYCRRKGLDDDIDLLPDDDDVDMHDIDQEEQDVDPRPGTEDDSEDGGDDDKGEGPSGTYHDD